jgi:hypothetical protein
MAIETKAVTGRRKLRFEALDDILAEVDRLDGRPVNALGNWTPGQVLRHLEMTMTRSLDGFTFKMPWHLRLMCKVMKRPLLSMKMPAGFKLSSEGSRDLDPPATEWADGVRLLRTVVGRLKTENQRAKSPAFGAMTVGEWNKLHCRHAELHLGFLSPA